MRESTAALLVALATVLITVLGALPVVMTLCDRSLVRARLVPPRGQEPARTRRVRRADPAAPGVPATQAEWFDGIARGVRAGLPATEAVITAPTCSASVRRLQEDLAAGGTLTDVLSRAPSAADPQLSVLRGCMPEGALSPAALELAAANARAEEDLNGEVRVAVSYAVHSARLLTVLPFLMLGGAALLSSGVRGGLTAAGPAAGIITGSLAGLAGSRWMRRIIRTASRPSQSATAAHVADTLVVHLAAGGTVPAALGALAPVHPACSEAARMLHEGRPLSESLSPLRLTAPSVTATIEQAHRDGLPLAGALSRTAADLRARDRDHVLAAVRRIPARAAAPLVLCVLPSFVLTAVVPLGLASIGAVRTPAT
ncbi:MAG: type II secretion system F family protein [Actinomycetota bacterium]